MLNSGMDCRKVVIIHTMKQLRNTKLNRNYTKNTIFQRRSEPDLGIQAVNWGNSLGEFYVDRVSQWFHDDISWNCNVDTLIK